MDDNKRSKVPAIVVGLLLVAAIAGTVIFGYRFMQENKAAQEEWASGYSDRVTPTITPSASKTTSDVSSETSETSEEEPEETPTPEPVVLDPAPSISGDALVSETACMIRLADGAEVLNKDKDRICYPASLTKIMTAILVIELAPDLNAKVTIYPEDIDPNYEQGATLAGFEPYEEVPLIDLVYAIMLPSGAEACDAAATAVCPTTEDFVAKMNEKAAELGMGGTHFANITGLHSVEHMSTCSDIAKLMKYALSNDTFREVISTPSYTCTPTAQHPEGLSFSSTLFSQLTATTMTNGAVIEGGKTGTTDEAGKCLASFGRYGMYEYVLVTMLAPVDSTSNISDAVTCYSSL